MNETIENFGTDDHLSGTLCIPDINAGIDNAPCIIMLNAGLIYQAGPSRLHVEMARELARHGICSLRFDLSGIGDSGRRRDNNPYDRQILCDIGDALTYVEEKTGISSFVLMGICTGADNTHKYALEDDRVTGTVFLDGYAYKTAGYYFRYYGPRIINPVKIFKRLRHLVTAQVEQSVAPASEKDAVMEKEKDGYFWKLPAKEKTVKELQKLADRNVCQLHVYTAEWEWCFNHQSQFESMYKDVNFNGLASCVYFDKSDHVFTLMDDRRQLVNTVINWLTSSFNLKSQKC